MITKSFKNFISDFQWFDFPFILIFFSQNCEKAIIFQTFLRTGKDLFASHRLSDTQIDYRFEQIDVKKQINYIFLD